MPNRPKSIPVLKDKAAQDFTNRITANTLKKASVNFSKQAEIAAEILKKARIQFSQSIIR